ncbi:MAG: sulfotransferase family protein [Bacteroidales bacterium]|nr:sulfotransferase family protein [Bacteroidales bacterium]
MNPVKTLKAYLVNMKRRISQTHGMIVNARGNKVSGWVLLSKNGKTTDLRLYINKKYMGHLAFQAEPPKEKPGKRIAFCFSLNKPLMPGDTVSVKSRLLKAELRNSPRIIPMNNSYASVLEHHADLDDEKAGLFFLHIPKTAGTTLWKTLSKHFPFRSQLPDRFSIIASGGYPHFHYPLEQSEGTIKYCRFLFGHYPFVFKKLLGNNTKVITFLRDPVKRVVSQMYHLKTREREYRNWSYGNLYEKRIRKSSNLQVRYLCLDAITNKLRPDLLGEVGEEELERASNNLRDSFFVGITEQFGQSISLLEAKLGITLGKIKKRNISKKKPDISPDLLQKIESDNQLDRKLYEFGYSLFLINCETFGLKPD